MPSNFALWEGHWTYLGEVSAGKDGPRDIQRARDAGLGIVAMKPLMAGLASPPEERRSWADAVRQKERAAVLAAALRWILANRLVNTASVMTNSQEHLARNTEAAAQTFTDADRRLLASELNKVGAYYCRMCHRCEGSYRLGLPVEDLMRFLLCAEGCGDPGGARRCFAALPPAVRAARCDTCNGCTVRCPNGVRVRTQVGRAQRVLS